MDGRFWCRRPACSRRWPACSSSRNGCTTNCDGCARRGVARRWSKEEQAAAGVDPSLETWELTLHRPRGDAFEGARGTEEVVAQTSSISRAFSRQPPPSPLDAFEIRGVRQTPLSGLPVVISLASLPAAVAQRGEVTIRSLRPSGLSVENRRLKPILPEPPPPGQVQTIRGAFRYDPARDVADGAQAAIRVNASSNAIVPAAWIGDCRLESWHQSDGTVRHLATYNLESAGCNRLRLTMPPGIARDCVRGVRIDGVPAAWQMVTVGETRYMSVELPAERKSFCVTIEWTVSGPPLGIVGSLAASLPEPDLPVLARHWIAWLPPGYENCRFRRLRATCRSSTSAEAQGWTGRCVDVSADTPVALRYARVASMQLLGAVAFLLAAGLGCWTVRRRGDGGSRRVAGGLLACGDHLARRLRSRRLGRPVGGPLLPGGAVGPLRPAAERSIGRRERSSRRCEFRQHYRNGADRAGDARPAAGVPFLWCRACWGGVCTAATESGCGRTASQGTVPDRC